MNVQFQLFPPSHPSSPAPGETAQLIVYQPGVHHSCQPDQLTADSGGVVVEVVGDCKYGVDDGAGVKTGPAGLEVVGLGLRAGIALCRGCAVLVPWYPQTGHVHHELLHLAGHAVLDLPGRDG